MKVILDLCGLQNTDLSWELGVESLPPGRTSQRKVRRSIKVGDLTDRMDPGIGPS